ncbi:hypothetical protein GCM10027419_34390 [Pandoraea terrae]
MKTGRGSAGGAIGVFWALMAGGFALASQNGASHGRIAATVRHVLVSGSDLVRNRGSPNREAGGRL